MISACSTICLSYIWAELIPSTCFNLCQYVVALDHDILIAAWIISEHRKCWNCEKWIKISSDLKRYHQTASICSQVSMISTIMKDSSVDKMWIKRAAQNQSMRVVFSSAVLLKADFLFFWWWISVFGGPLFVAFVMHLRGRLFIAFHFHFIQSEAAYQPKSSCQSHQ